MAHDDAHRARQQSETELNAANRTLAEQDSKLEVLCQLAEAGEGFGEGTQAVLRGLDNPDFFKPAVQGALASFIEVEAQFIPAVEAALGANLQAIVFKDPSVAEAAVATLGGKKLGRAAIVPRDWLGATPASFDALPEGALAWAADCVKVSDPAGELARQLLAGVAVVERIDTAFALKAQHRALGFVTLDGDFISRDGIVHGGRTGDTSNSALARKNQILALEKDVAASRALVADCTNRRDSAAETLDLAQDRLRMAREAVQAAQVAHSTAQSELSMLERQRGEAERRRENSSRETASIEQSVVEAATRASELESGIGGLEASLQEARARQGEAQARIETARERERHATDELNELRVRVATERQQQETLARQRGPLTARVAELTELLAQREKDIADYETRIATLQSEAIELESNIETWRLLLETGEQQIAGLVAQKSEIQENVEAMETALRSSRRQLSELQESRGRYEVRSTQLEMRLENVTGHVSQRYQVVLADFQPDSYALIVALRDREKKARAAAEGETSPTEGEAPVAAQPVAEEESAPAEEVRETIPWGRIEELVAELTGKLDSMGPVNLDAIRNTTNSSSDTRSSSSRTPTL